MEIIFKFNMFLIQGEWMVKNSCEDNISKKIIYSLALFSSTLQHTLTPTYKDTQSCLMGESQQIYKASLINMTSFRRKDTLQISAGLSLRLYDIESANEADSSPDLNPQRFFTCISASNEDKRFHCEELKQEPGK